MALSAGTYQLGPDTGALHLRTTREGVAAKVGHDLTLEFAQWSGTLTLTADDPAGAQLEVEIQLDSLTVLDGTGGAMALTDNDRADIKKNAMKVLEVQQHPTATFSSSAVKPADGRGGLIEGQLTVRGQSAPITVEVSETGESSWHGTATMQQTAHGIKPYRAFFGALKLSDSVGIEVDVELPAGG